MAATTTTAAPANVETDNECIVLGGELQHRYHRGTNVGLLAFIGDMLPYRTHLSYKSIAVITSEHINIPDSHYTVSSNGFKYVSSNSYYQLTNPRIIKHVTNVGEYMKLGGGNTIKFYDHTLSQHPEYMRIPRALSLRLPIPNSPHAEWVVQPVDMTNYSLYWLSNIYSNNVGVDLRKSCHEFEGNRINAISHIFRIGALLFELDYNYNRATHELTVGARGDTIPIDSKLQPFFSKNKPSHTLYHTCLLNDEPEYVHMTQRLDWLSDNLFKECNMVRIDGSASIPYYGNGGGIAWPYNYKRLKVPDLE